MLFVCSSIALWMRAGKLSRASIVDYAVDLKPQDIFDYIARVASAQKRRLWAFAPSHNVTMRRREALVEYL